MLAEEIKNFLPSPSGGERGVEKLKGGVILESEVIRGKFPENPDPMFTLLSRDSVSIDRLVTVLAKNLTPFEYRSLCRQLEDGFNFIDGDCVIDSIDDPDSFNRAYAVQAALERGIFWSTICAAGQIEKNIENRIQKK